MSSGPDRPCPTRPASRSAPRSLQPAGWPLDRRCPPTRLRRPPRHRRPGRLRRSVGGGGSRSAPGRARRSSTTRRPRSARSPDGGGSPRARPVARTGSTLPERPLRPAPSPTPPRAPTRRSGARSVGHQPHPRAASGSRLWTESTPRRPPRMTLAGPGPGWRRPARRWRPLPAGTPKPRSSPARPTASRGLRPPPPTPHTQTPRPPGPGPATPTSSNPCPSPNPPRRASAANGLPTPALASSTPPRSQTAHTAPARSPPACPTSTGCPAPPHPRPLRGPWRSGCSGTRSWC